jgi:hypothetical protein
MANREMLKVGNNTIQAAEEFAHGYHCGDLYYYDTHYLLPYPFTGEAIQAFMIENLFDKQATPAWNAGFMFGWITALGENNASFFFASILIPESEVVTEQLPTFASQEV